MILSKAQNVGANHEGEEKEEDQGSWCRKNMNDARRASSIPRYHFSC
jgi:hypothetical protein